MKNIKPFWDDEFKKLDYRKEIFNDEYAIDEWRKSGYNNDVENFSGHMANHNDKQPKWNEIFKSWAFHEHGLNQGTTPARAERVCRALKNLHEDDMFQWPSFHEDK